MSETTRENRMDLPGHLAAFFSVFVWGGTFAASKQLLAVYSPGQLLVLRFALGYATLWCMYPRWEKPDWREEGRFFLLGLVNTLYFLAENTALMHTYSANVSILVATAPIFTVLLVILTGGGERVRRRVWLGFALALAGVALVVFNGAVGLHLSPRGDLLSLAAAFFWGLCSLWQARALETRGSLLVARKMIFYGLATSLPLLLAEGAPELSLLLSWERAGCLALLGVVGSGLSYSTWAWSMARLGVIRANSYIFAIPFITMALSFLLLGEPVTAMGAAGAVLIVGGVALSQR